MGRPTKCTMELIDKIYRILRAGNYIETACAIVGITSASYRKWRARAEEEIVRRERGEEPRDSEEPYVAFFAAITRARAESEAQAVAQIRKAAEKDWRANAWYLEHSHRERWGKRSIDVTSGGEKVRGVIVLPDNGRGEE